ncbi:PRA1 family protein H, partial [Mucuna pruriens]
MVFSSNPLALSIPEPAFESWLRDTGYLEILDHRTSSSAAAADPKPSGGGVFSRLFTFLSLFSLNPFAKLTADDFAADTPSWSRSFFGFSNSYSFPSCSSQARMRVHENVKRYARNYAYLFILFFACTLYKMPVALLGLILCLALWDLFKFCSHRWGLEQYPLTRKCFLRIAQCATAVILIFSNVQMALFFAICVSYAGESFYIYTLIHTLFPSSSTTGSQVQNIYAGAILHAAFRKLTPVSRGTVVLLLLSGTSHFPDSRAFGIEDFCAYNVEFKTQDFGTEDFCAYNVEFKTQDFGTEDYCAYNVEFKTQDFDTMTGDKTGVVRIKGILLPLKREHRRPPWGMVKLFLIGKVESLEPRRSWLYGFVAMGAASRQLKVMLRKNWLLKIRHPFVTVAEILLPTIVLLLLAAVRTQVDTQIHLDLPQSR